MNLDHHVIDKVYNHPFKTAGLLGGVYLVGVGIGKLITNTLDKIFKHQKELNDQGTEMYIKAGPFETGTRKIQTHHDSDSEFSA